jgi:antitoxin Phd
MHTWQLQDAKSRFSEVVNRALTEGPQWVTRRGQDAVVMLSANDFRRFSGTPSLVDVLLNAPRGEPLDMERSREPVRSLNL